MKLFNFLIRNKNLKNENNLLKIKIKFKFYNILNICNFS